MISESEQHPLRVSVPKAGEERRVKIPAPHSVITVSGSLPFAVTKDIFTGERIVVQANEIPLPNSWDEISGIHMGRGQAPQTSEELVRFVELPLLKAARMLYKAKIKTSESNAHFEPDQDETVIALVIPWEKVDDSGRLVPNLNTEQQKMANYLVKTDPERWKHGTHHDGYEIFALEWRIKRNDPNTTPREVKKYVDDKVDMLVKGRFISLPGTK